MIGGATEGVRSARGVDRDPDPDGRPLRERDGQGDEELLRGRVGLNVEARAGA